MADKNLRTQWDLLFTGLQNYEKYRKETEKATRANIALANATTKTNKGMKGVTSTLVYFNKEGHKVTKTAKFMNNRLVGYNQKIDQTTASTNKAATATKNFGVSWAGVQKIIVGSVIARSIGHMMSAFTQGIGDAREFAIRIGEIRTISQDSPRGFDTWALAVRNLSDEFGTSLLETAEGQYQTLSNQIAKGAESTQFLRDAQEFALISVSSTSDAVNLLSGALNAYGRSAKDADQVSAQFFKTIELGRLRASDIANTFGRVAILGDQLSIPLEELQGSLATLTIKGVQPAEAMTFLRNVLLKLIRPTSQMKEIFKEWGVNSGSAAISTFGFTGVIRKLAEGAEASGDQIEYLGNAFGRIRAIVGATGLTGAFEDIEENTNEIKNAAEDANKALEEMHGNVGVKMRKELQQMKNFFVVDVGLSVLSALIAINDNFLDISNTLKYVFVTGAKFAAGFAAMMGGKLLLATAALIWELGILEIAMYAISEHPLLIGFTAGFLLGELALQLNEAGEAVNSFIADYTDEFIAASDAREQKFTSETEKIVGATEKQVQEQIREIDQLFAFLTAKFNELKGINDVRKRLEADILKETLKNATARDRLRIVGDLLVAGARKYADELARAREDGKVSLDESKELEDQLDARVAIAKELGKLESVRLRSGRKVTGAQYEATQVKAITKDRKALSEILNKNLGLENFNELAMRQQLETARAEGEVQKNKLRKIEAHAVAARDLTTEYLRAEKAALGMAEKLQAVDDVAVSISQSFGATGGILGGLIGAVQGQSPRADAIKEILPDAKEIAAIKDEMAGLLALGDSRNPQQDIALQAAAVSLVEKIAELRATPTADKFFPDEYFKELDLFAAAVLVTVNAHKDLQSSTDSFKLIEANLAGLTNKFEPIYTGFAAIELAQQGLIDTNVEGVTLMKSALTTLDPLLKAKALLIDDLTRKAAALNAALAGKLLPNQIPQNNAVGGIVKYFASGGGTVGSDKIPARLAAGEFVMDRSASRRFMPALTGMNGRSVGYAEGGNVSNTTVGDVNVTVQGGDTTEATVRQLGNALRRELKRGNLRLS